MQENTARKVASSAQNAGLKEVVTQHQVSLDPGELPRWPKKRRLSARAWQMVWDIQMANALRAPATVNKFVRQFNSDQQTFGAKPRTSTRLCLSLTAEQMDDVQMTEQVFAVIRAVEEQYGPVAQIEGRSADEWPLYAVKPKAI